MKTLTNTFKAALRDGRPQIGLWLGLADHYTAEICAGAGFDWLLIDGEHSPNDLRSILQQLQAIAGYPGTHAIARVPMGHGHVGQMLIKQYLDLGVQTLLVPMVDTADQATEIVRSMRYPPSGIRGMAGARASRWGRHPRYAHEANDEVCLLVQVETLQALENLQAIASTDGVDGVFIGPADLSASLGHVGNPTHLDVQNAIESAIQQVIKAGKAAGILTADEVLARRYIELGAKFVAVGLDTTILARGATGLASRFNSSVILGAADKTY